MEDNELDPRQRRRQKVGVPAVCRTDDGKALDVELHDLSEQGCRIASEEGTLSEDQDVVVRPEGLEALAGKIRWSHEKTAGVEFASRLHPAVVDHVSGEEPLEGYPPPRRASNSGFTDHFGRPLPTLGGTRRSR